MAKFQYKQLAGETLVLPYEVGTVELDAEGFFEFSNEQLEAELKEVRGFVFIPEPQAEPEPVVEEPKEKKGKGKKAQVPVAPAEEVTE